MFETCVISTPKIGKVIQFDEHIFSDGLKPPTRFYTVYKFLKGKKGYTVAYTEGRLSLRSSTEHQGH